MQTIHGDITQVTSGIILHQVNCQNTMGSGVRIRFKILIISRLISC